MGSSNKEANLAAQSGQGEQPVRSGPGGHREHLGFDSVGQDPLEDFEQGLGASDLNFKGLSEECTWKMGSKSKYGDKESIAKAAAFTLGRDGGGVDRALAG